MVAALCKFRFKDMLIQTWNDILKIKQETKMWIFPPTFLVRRKKNLRISTLTLHMQTDFHLFGMKGKK